MNTRAAPRATASAAADAPPADAAADTAPLAVLGGSFDPVHLGHLRLAQAAQAALGTAEVVFMPAGQPWQKDPPTPAPHRLRMLELALREHPGWRIDRRELDRPGPTYTVDTALELRAAAGPRRPLVWILGYDQLHGLPGWHRWQELLQLVHLAVAQRPGSPAELAPALRDYVQAHAGTLAELRAAPAGRVLALDMAPADCSASALRAALRAGERELARAWLPAAVLDYIDAHRLYAGAHGN